MHVVVLQEHSDIVGREVHAICDRIVVQHTRQRRRLDDRIEVRFGLAPVSPVDVRGKDHETAASRLLSRTRERDALLRTEPGDSGDDGNAIADRSLQNLEHADFLVECERCALPERSERHDATTSVVDHPARVRREERLVNRVI